MEHHICITKKVCNFTRLSKADILNLHHAIKIHVLSLQKKKGNARKQCVLVSLYTSMGSFIVSSRIYTTMSVCASLSFRLIVPLEGQKSRTLASLGSACQVKVTSPRNPTLRLTLNLTVVFCPYSS